MTVPSELRLDVELGPIRADGWFEDFLESMDDVDLLSAVFGPRGLGYLLLAGVKVESVSLDQADPSGSVVAIRLPDDRIARAPARVLVHKAVDAIVEQLRHGGPAPESADLDAVREFIGARTLLAAAMFDIAISRLRVALDGRAFLDVTDGDDVRHIELHELSEILVQRMEEDVAAVEDARLDAATLTEARAASERGDHDEVLGRLEPFAAMLASTLRSGALASMSPDVRADVVEAVDLLGRAYFANGDAPTAETLWRLGAQGCRGEPESARLFVRLGEAALARGGAGEAIGSLRRAAALGARPRDLGVPLATALAERGRHVAALSVARDGIADGLAAEAFGGALDASRAVAGVPFDRLATRLRPLT